jgi:hypothetical protein
VQVGVDVASLLVSRDRELVIVQQLYLVYPLCIGVVRCDIHGNQAHLYLLHRKVHLSHLKPGLKTFGAEVHTDLGKLESVLVVFAFDESLGLFEKKRYQVGEFSDSLSQQ